MSYGKPPKEYQFKKGQSGNPSGRPKDLLTKDKVNAVLARFSDLTKEELKGVLDSKKSTMLEVMIASVMMKAAENGDPIRLDFLWNRSIGRVKEEIEIIDTEREELSKLTLKELVIYTQQTLPEALE